MSWLVDVNVCVAISLSGHGHHQRSLRWYDSTRDRDPIVVCRPVQISMLRLLTTEAVTNAYSFRALNNKDAWQWLKVWMDRPNVIIQQEPDDMESLWQQFASRSTSSPKLWMDAYLAAFAVAADLTLVTTDKAFLQFKGCRVQLLT